MILEDKLSLWASAPSPTEMQKIQNAKNLIEEKLKSFLSISEIKQKHNLSSLDFDVYLQGSYRNSTNIRFDSDLDIVVQVNSVFYPNKEELTQSELQAYSKVHSDAQYNFTELKNDIYTALYQYFKDEIEFKSKCLRIEGNSNRVPADIVPCFQYRVYKRFISLSENHFIEGIKFCNTDTNEVIINYPKVHYENGCAKNSDTDGNYKAMVRIFKSIKSKLVENNSLEDKDAPSYFIENMIYNCTSHCFDGTYQEQMQKILQFLIDAIKQDRLKSFYCANEQDMLFSEGKWDIKKAINFINLAGNYFINN